MALGLLADGTYGDGLNGIKGGVTGLLYGDGGQFLAEFIGVVANVVYIGLIGWVVFKLIDLAVGNRVKPEDELMVQSACSGAIYGNFKQLGIQAVAVAVTIVFSGIGTYILFKITEKTVGIRVEDKAEAIGLDETQHGETAYTSFD